jgi:hypothetical protein
MDYLTAAVPVRTLLSRIVVIALAGAAALLAVATLDGQIEDVGSLFGAAPAPSGYQRLAADAAAACGALGAERESCEVSLMRLQAEPAAQGELVARTGL